MSELLRLGVYVDVRYEPTDAGLRADSAFAPFVAALARHVDELVVVGRAGSVPAPVATISEPNVRFVPLADYASLAAIGSVARAVAPSRAAWRAALVGLDALLVFGPHPIGALLVRDASHAGVPVALGVRQDLPAYLGPRAASRVRPAVLAAAHAIEASWRHSARRLPSVVTGDDLARRYRAARRLLDVTFSLVEPARIAGRRPTIAWDRPVTALSIGRLDPEKNPMLLADVAAGLDDVVPGSRLRVVGDGTLHDALAAEVGARSLPADLVGAIPQGDRVWRELARADVFVHVSTTEGQPQVLLEAMAAGVPIVATDVGGVGAMLGHGERGLLVPPGDATAITTALRRFRDDPGLRERVTEAGREFASEHTVDAESRRVVEFVTLGAGRRAGHAEFSWAGR